MVNKIASIMKAAPPANSCLQARTEITITTKAGNRWIIKARIVWPILYLPLKTSRANKLIKITYTTARNLDTHFMILCMTYEVGVK